MMPLIIFDEPRDLDPTDQFRKEIEKFNYILKQYKPEGHHFEC